MISKELCSYPSNPRPLRTVFCFLIRNWSFQPLNCFFPILDCKSINPFYPITSTILDCQSINPYYPYLAQTKAWIKLVNSDGCRKLPGPGRLSNSWCTTPILKIIQCALLYRTAWSFLQPLSSFLDTCIVWKTIPKSGHTLNLCPCPLKQ